MSIAVTNVLDLLKAVGRTAVARSIGMNLSAFTRGRRDSEMRILFVANALVPTLQLSFLKPLATLIDNGKIAIELLSEQQMRERFGKPLESNKVKHWIERRLQRFCPTIIVFCRYSGPNAEHIVKLARNNGIAVLLHIDDDLLCVPPEIGRKKYEYHNQPARLATVRYLLQSSDLVYCSTPSLRQRLLPYRGDNNLITGDIYCSGEVLALAQPQRARKIGYMGFDHAQDFELALPALISTLREFPYLTFDLFGAIDKPQALNEFGARIRVIPPVYGYNKFMQKLASLRWDIGICPLTKSAFNSAKANTKWVEYTSVGAAVIASQNTVYDECCSAGRGLLVDGDSAWADALRKLVTQGSERVVMVQRAQREVVDTYSSAALTRQILSIMQQVSRLPIGTLATDTAQSSMTLQTQGNPINVQQ
jgi:glycosyltransferase involved in cell wall biosynthesis